MSHQYQYLHVNSVSRDMVDRKIELSPEEWDKETIDLFSMLFLTTIYGMVDNLGRERALEILTPAFRNVTKAGAIANVARFNLDPEKMVDISAAFCHIKKCFKQELQVLECTQDSLLLEVTHCPFEASGIDVCELLELSANQYVEGLNPELEGSYETAKGRGDASCRYRIIRKRTNPTTREGTD
jgi:hypothetical protein